MIDSELVGIAQISLARAPNSLCCLGLGSCVAVFLYDPHMKMGGVLHALLPNAPDEDPSPEKYADTGIRKLLYEMTSRGAKMERIVAKLVGGAQMFPNLNLKMTDIGGLNIESARAVLRRLGVRIVAEEVKGNTGRSAFFSMEDGRVRIKTAFAQDKSI
jgi:chemotaxis protein CheD